VYRLITIAVVCLFLIGLLAYVGLRIWRRNKLTGATVRYVNFQPHIGFTRQDGWVSLALMLFNRSGIKVWAEEVKVGLTDLRANDQTDVASRHAIHPIRQTVGPGDMLPISLVEAIYEAAGKPQRRYSCFLSVIVRYRAGDQWFEKTLKLQKIKMAGFKVHSVKPVRWYEKKAYAANTFEHPEKTESESTPVTSHRTQY
jgi:hypothetical protein